jgi:phosphatidylglycerophosphate synthase
LNDFPSGSVRANLDALRSAQKPARGTAAYSRLVNRPAGRVVAAMAHRLGVSPNQATAVSATLSGAAIVLIAVARPSWLTGLLIAVLLAAGYVMDSVDGQLARLRGGGSKAGEWLDHTIDCFKTAAIHLAVLVSWYRFPVSDNDAVLLVPLLFDVVAMVTYFGLMLMPTLRPTRTSSTLDQGGVENPLRKYLLLPVDYGIVCWSFVVWGSSAVFPVVYAVLFAAAAGALLLALRKWWREVRYLDAAAVGTGS